MSQLQQADKTFKQLLSIRQSKVEKAERAVSQEHMRLKEAKDALLSKEKMLEQTKQEAAAEEARQFEQAKSELLNSHQLEALLANISLLRQGVVAKAQSVEEQKKQVDDRQRSLVDAQKKLNALKKEHAKIEQAHSKVASRLVQWEQQQEDNQMDEFVMSLRGGVVQ